jgi:heat shock 70kDa protein 4
MQLNIIIVTLLLQMIEEEETEVPVSSTDLNEPPKEAAKMETDHESQNDGGAAGADVNMQDSKPESDTGSAAPGSENGVSQSNDKPMQMETENKVTSILLRFLYTFILVVVFF